MSAKILSNAKNKLTSKARKRVMQSRYVTVINPSVAIAKPVQDCIMAHIAGLNMSNLVRKMTQCPNRIRRAKAILDDLSPDSSFAPGIRHNIAVNVFVLSAVENEVKRRMRTPAVRDTRTPRVRKWDALKASIAAQSTCTNPNPGL